MGPKFCKCLGALPFDIENQAPDRALEHFNEVNLFVRLFKVKISMVETTLQMHEAAGGALPQKTTFV